MKLFHHSFTRPLLRIFNPTKLLSFGAIICLFIFFAEEAFAWTLYNKSLSKEFKYEVYDESLKLIEEGSVPKNSSVGCSWDKKSCNPGVARDSELTAVFKSTGSEQWACTVTLVGGGSANIYEVNNSGFPNMYWCYSEINEHNNKKDLDINGDGVKNVDKYVGIDWSDDYLSSKAIKSGQANFTPADRNVRFFVTGDPQIDYRGLDSCPYLERCNASLKGNNSNWDQYNQVKTAFDTFDNMTAKLRASRYAYKRWNSDVRGIIVSGDLTEKGRWDEIKMYLGMATADNVFKNGLNNRHPWEQHIPLREKLYEGMGNHDQVDDTNPDNILRANCAKDGAFSEVGNDCEAWIANYVADHKRNSVKTSQPKLGDLTGELEEFEPHYSWEWHDVHFVQLNVVPLNKGTTGDKGWLQGLNALTFLQTDLANKVGSSGRPVVLIHHYGFDDFSIGNSTGEIWWNADDRKAYWNAIASYNVIAIFTGHRHIDASSSEWNYYTFEPPFGATGWDIRPDGRTEIRAFNAAATRNGAYLDVTINSCNQLIVKRKDMNGTEHDSDTVDFKTDGWGEKNPDCEVDAKCKADFTVATDSLSCSATGVSIDKGSSGECTQTPATIDILGKNKVSLDCTSLLGNTDSCTTNVTLVDQTKPTIPGAIFLSLVECGIPLGYTMFSTFDNCPDPRTICEPDNSTPAILGNNIVTCTASDSSKNQSTFQFVQAGVDNIPPELISPPSDATVECTGPVTPAAAVSFVPLKATDLCDKDLLKTNDKPPFFNLGKTQINWTISDDSNHEISTRNTITIVDTTKPAIQLEGANPVRLECGVDKYSEPGFTVQDVCDMDPRSKVSLSGVPNTVGGYHATYTARDASGNQAEATRSILVQDTTKPIVQLKGDNPFLLECGTKYREPGAGAMDACDGSLPVTIKGAVDSTILGQQTLSYGAMDTQGLAEIVQRLVIVQDNSAPKIQCPLNMTFDPQSPEGRIVDYPLAITKDRCDAAPYVACNPPPGDTFAIGTTTDVQCMARDYAKNEASCSFSVTIYSVAEVIQNMLTIISDLGVNGVLTIEQEQELNGILDQVLYDNNATPLACNQLQSFKNIIRDFLVNGVLIATQAQPLVTSADNLSATFACGQ